MDAKLKIDKRMIDREDWDLLTIQELDDQRKLRQKLVPQFVGQLYKDITNTEIIDIYRLMVRKGYPQLELKFGE